MSNCFNLKLKCNGRKQFTFFLRCYMIAQCKHAAQSGVKANRIAFSIRFVVFNKKILSRRFSAKSFPETMSKRKSKVETISAEILVLNVCDHWMIIVTEYSIQEKRLSESILIFSGPVFTGSNINRVYRNYFWHIFEVVSFFVPVDWPFDSTKIRRRSHRTRLLSYSID